MDWIVFLQLFGISSIATILVVLLLRVLFRFFPRKEQFKPVFIIASVLTVLVHYSSCIISLVRGESIVWEDNLYLPVYPCNVFMWLCLTISFLFLIHREESEFFRLILDFTVTIGTCCGFIGLFFNFNYLAVQTLADYGTFKGLLSHVTMIFNTLALFKYYKFDVDHTMKSCVFGGGLLLLCGIYSNTVMHFLGEEINSMYLRESPLDVLPWLTFPTILLLGLLIILGVLTILERFIKPGEPRWYEKLRTCFRKDKNI